MKDLYDAYVNLQEQQPRLRVVDAAIHLGVTEAEIVAARVGKDAVRLNDDFANMLKGLKNFGKVMALARNKYVVTEISGIYEKVYVQEEEGKLRGIALNPGGIDLRFFFDNWHSGYAVTTGRFRSIQFFDKHGTAIQKIFLKDESKLPEYQAFVADFTHESQSTLFDVNSRKIPENKLLPDEQINVAALEKGWSEITDVHQFPKLLATHKVGRLQALTLVDDKWAQEISPNSLTELLRLTRDKQVELMCFVSNKGIVQIYSGQVNTLKEVSGWYNVLDPDFNLHVDMKGLSRAFISHKPTDEGGVLVSSVEFFNSDDETVLTFFGRRVEGKSQSKEWKNIISLLAEQAAVSV